MKALAVFYLNRMRLALEIQPDYVSAKIAIDQI